MMVLKHNETFLWLLVIFDVIFTCEGLIWGGFDSSRTGGWGFTYSGHSTLRDKITSSGGSIGELTSEITDEYLNTINIFFTSYMKTSVSLLSETEQNIIVSWVGEKGGIVLVGGCNHVNYAECRSIAEPFGIGVQDTYKSGSFISTCFPERHEILNDVNNVAQSHSDLFITEGTNAIELCQYEDGKITDVLLPFGHGFVLFSNTNTWHDAFLSNEDGPQYAENFVTRTETLRCCGNALPGKCSCELCDDDNECTVDRITANGCSHAAIECIPDTQCVASFCDPNFGCQYRNTEECFPTLTTNSEKLVQIEENLESIEELLSRTSQPTQTPTQEPTDIPTDIPTDMPTDMPTWQPTEMPTSPPTSGTLGIPTLPPQIPPTSPPTSAPTPIPIEELIGKLLEEAVQEIITSQDDIKTTITTTLESLETRVLTVETQVDLLNENFETFLMSLHPTPTVPPTTVPTPLLTVQPTREPVVCIASPDSGKDDFILEEYGTCFEEAVVCQENENCSTVLNSSDKCTFPQDILYSTNFCWENFFDSQTDGFTIWRELANCVLNVCDCVFESGRWTGETIAMDFKPSALSCCVSCKKFESCFKWQFTAGGVCVFLGETAVPDDSSGNLWDRGVGSS